MGISPSSGFLQAAVTYALSPVKNNVINYSDNILVHSSPERHADVLAETLALLKSHGFKIKKNKMPLQPLEKLKFSGAFTMWAKRLCHPTRRKLRP